MAHSVSVLSLSPMLCRSLSPWSWSGHGLHTRKERGINTHRCVCRAGGGIHHLGSNSISENAGTCPPSPEMDSPHIEERECRPTPLAVTPAAWPPSYPQRTHPLPEGASPSPIQSLRATQRPGFLGDGRSSQIDAEGAPHGSRDLRTETQAVRISPAQLFPRIMISSGTDGTAILWARNHILVPSLCTVLADFVASSYTPPVSPFQKSLLWGSLER